MTSTRELRRLLTAIDNQDMTVRELRQRLFNEDDQDSDGSADNAVRYLP